METNSLNKSFVWKQRLGFGAIDFGRVLVQSFADMYLSVFLTTVALVPLKAVTLMFLTCKIIDAITDVVVGALVDKTNTRIGRARPWMYAGAIIFAIGAYLLFQAPELAVGSKIVYAYATYIIYTLGLTMCNIPEGSMMALLSNDPNERTMFGSIRGISATVGNTILGNCVAPMVALFGVGNEVIGYSKTMMVFVLIMVALMLIGNSVVKEIAEPIHKTRSGGVNEVFSNLKAFFTCKNFNCEMLFCFGNLLYTVAVASTMAYYCLFVLDHRMDLMGLGFTVQSVLGFFSPLLAPFLNKKMNKSNITLVGAFVAAGGIALRYLAPSIPIMLVVGMAIYGFGQGFLNVMIQTTQPDIVDELAVKIGTHNPGLAMAMFSLGCQIGAGVSNALVTFILDLGGFDGSAMAQSPAAITAINVAFGGIAILAFVIIAIAMRNYDLDKRFPEIQAKLAEMRAANNEGA